ncbi:hypothetical protein ANANG_G00063850 [Anguilla anguilla]|uniref:Uncharacterized protein n=1 Tax=Anguilla anguilla TaxID=7936 RepID=A0A9D3S2R4_ANGAN|nr:hypothetical protein ANANG_G00063850 [Anguilla anguilla]
MALFYFVFVWVHSLSMRQPTVFPGTASSPSQGCHTDGYTGVTSPAKGLPPGVLPEISLTPSTLDLLEAASHSAKRGTTDASLTGKMQIK